MVCSITSPGHNTNLTGVKIGLALLRDPFRAPVVAEVAAIDGERITLRLPDGELEARCHDAVRLGALLDAAVSARGVAPRALFTAHEHQLFVEVDPDVHPLGLGTECMLHGSSTGSSRRSTPRSRGTRTCRAGVDGRSIGRRATVTPEQ